MSASHWIDLALGAVLLVSALIGVLRGFVRELMGLAGLAVAYFLARDYGPVLAQHVSLPGAADLARRPLAYAAVFVLVLMLWSLLSWLVRRFVQATPMHELDRGLGAAFGLARGVLIVVAAAALALLTDVTRSAAWRSSVVAGLAEQGLLAASPLLPVEVRRALAHSDVRARRAQE